MNNATKTVLEAFKEDILTLSHLILEDDSISSNRKTNKNTLANSHLRDKVRAEISKLGEPVVIEALFDNYVTFLEWDRPKKYGEKPPIDSLLEWAKSKGIPTDNNTLFAISTAIWRDGHEGRPILATLEKEIEKSYNNEVSDNLFNAIIDELTKYFN